MICEFFTLYYTTAGIFLGLVVLYFVWAWAWPCRSKAPVQPPPEQQMLYMSAALTAGDQLIDGLHGKMNQRSLEIAKADNRFLVTPDDMRRAYYELIREEYDDASNPL